MPTFTLQAPDGRKIDIEAADEATAIRGAQEWGRANPRKKGGIGGLAKSYVTGVAQSVAPAVENLFGLGDVGPLSFAAKSGKIVEDVASAANNIFLGQKGQKSKTPSRLAPVSDEVARRGHKPETVGEEYAQTAGQMTPNIFAPGSIPARIANVVLPAVFSETAGQVSRGMGANEQGQAVARGLGAVGGAGAASVRAPNLFAPRAAPTPAEIVATRARPEPAAMRARAAEMRATGVQPSLVDVAGEKGRRLIRAVGVKSEEGGEALTARANEVSAATKPGAMVATRRLHPDSRTANQYADELETARGAEADTNYAKFDDRPIEVPDTVIDMLSDSPGRSIIARARADASERQDWPRLAELDKLLKHQPGEPLPRVSAGTLDKLAAAARDRGTAFAAKPGGATRAAGSFGRREQIDATLDGVDELKPTRSAFREKSQAIDVARDKNRLDPFSTDPQDYGAWLQGLPPEAHNANRIAIRQDILDTLGGQRSNTFGTLDELATSPYARDNLRLAFGPQEADRYVSEIQARLAQTRNARFVEPNAGSRTAVLENDVGDATKRGLELGGRAVRGDVGGVVSGGIRWAAEAFMRRGVSKEQAEALARMAVDPAQTDAAIAQIAQRLAPQERQQLLELRNAARVGAVGAVSGAQPGRQERQ